MGHRGLLTLVALAALLAAAPARAQLAENPIMPPPGDDVFSLRRGDRVRVWAAESPPLAAAIGIVNAADHEGLAVVVRQRMRLVPFADLKKIEVRRYRRHAGTGALAGAVMGAFVSLFLEEIVGRHLNSWEWTAGVAAATGAGAGLGAAVGYEARTHRWVPLGLGPPPPPQPAPPTPAPGRPRFSLTLHF